MTEPPCPSFLGIGAQRAATTWVHESLRQNPALFLPEEKELHFFTDRYDRGWDWYASKFAAAETGQLSGEITPNYLEHAQAAERISTQLPEVKLFVVLREPVSRARSSYELLREQYAGQSFEQVCTSGSGLVELGLYAKHLQRYFDHFDRSQIHVLLYDEIQSDGAAALTSLCQFLGVSPVQPTRAVSRYTNSMVFPRTQRVLTRVGLGGIVEVAKQGPWGRALRGGAAQLRRLQRSTDGQRKLKDLFRDDIEQLERLLQRDLHHWLA